MSVPKGPEGVCQAVRHPSKIYPFCMCLQPSAPGEYYCAEHLAERKADRKKLFDAARRSGREDA